MSQKLISVIYDLVTRPARACHKHAVVDPAVSRIPSLHGEM